MRSFRENEAFNKTTKSTPGYFVGICDDIDGSENSSVNPGTKSELEVTLAKALDLLKKHPGEDFDLVLFRLEEDKELAREFYEKLTASFRENHPEYVSGSMGTPTQRGGVSPSIVVRALTGHLLRKYGNSPTSEQLRSIIDEFELFTDTPTIEFSNFAPLVNFQAADRLENFEVIQDVTLRKISKQESDTLFKPVLGMSGFVSTLYPRPEWVLSTVRHEQKVFGDAKASPFDLANMHFVPDLFDKAIQVFRTFKSGPVYFHTVFSQPKRFVPVIGFTGTNARSPGQFSHQTGTYDLGADHIPPLEKHASYFHFESLDDALLLACSRLSQAEVRLEERDKLLDAVIGLEAVLLVDRSFTGEQRQLFALRYAALQPKDTRYAAYKKAYELYGARSKVAHGGRIAGDLGGLASTACHMLRSTVQLFLPAGQEPPFRQEGYWTRAVLDVPDDTVPAEPEPSTP